MVYAIQTHVDCWMDAIGVSCPPHLAIATHVLL